MFIIRFTWSRLSTKNVPMSAVAIEIITFSKKCSSSLRRLPWNQDMWVCINVFLLNVFSGFAGQRLEAVPRQLWKPHEHAQREGASLISVIFQAGKKKKILIPIL